MKPYQYHLLNSGIAGLLVTFGAFTTILTGELTTKTILIGVFAGVFSGIIIFLNKFNDWFKSQDPCDNLKLLNFL